MMDQSDAGQSQAGGMDRRRFLKTAAGAGVVLAAANLTGGVMSAAAAETGYANPVLPFAEGALEPHISAKTVSFHYGKHTAAYYANATKMVAGTPYAAMALKDVVLASAKKPEDAGLFNNAAQAWNHSFYWEQFTEGRGRFEGKAAEAVKAAFGDQAKFKEAFVKDAGSLFGSGWCWLCEDKGGLKIVKTSNAATPITEGLKPLLVVDVWEHAYYLDYQNRRPDHVAAVLDHLINWSVVAKRM